jgi:hypothetical protein
MNKTEQLLIRACKTQDPHKRVLNVYRRRYFTTDSGTADFYLVQILGQIAEKYLALNILGLLSDLDERNRWKYGVEAEDSYHTACVKLLISRIRLTEKDAFPGLTPPLRFRLPIAA